MLIYLDIHLKLLFQFSSIKMNRNHIFFICLSLVVLLNISCSNPERNKFEAYLNEGEQLAKTYCTLCHKETPPELLDKMTWTVQIMPQMGPRLGMFNCRTFYYKRIHPLAETKTTALTQEQWENIVDYFHYRSPDSLPLQEFDREPELQSVTFTTDQFTQDISSSSIISMIKVDTTNRKILTADVQNSVLYQFDYHGKLTDTLRLSSPPTAMDIDDGFLDITLAGKLHPNNEEAGSVVRYAYTGRFSHLPEEEKIDSLIRPVASLCYDFNYDGEKDFLICEYGNDIGRLTIQYAAGKSGYSQYIIEEVPGAIMVKIRDMNNDGFVDIVALFAQGDEKIVIYHNDGKGEFKGNFIWAARFPAVYGSLYFELNDYNNDGYTDILYVNGDNFDYSQILKPYHGIRIFENDGVSGFDEKYFYPMYGAGKSVTHDYDMDGDLDIMVTSNFADMDKNPERGIIYLENHGDYNYTANSFEAAAQNQWNTIGMADIDEDGDQDLLIGAMNLSNVLKIQNNNIRGEVDLNRIALLLLRNETNP